MNLGAFMVPEFPIFKMCIRDRHLRGEEGDGVGQGLVGEPQPAQRPDLCAVLRAVSYTHLYPASFGRLGLDPLF